MVLSLILLQITELVATVMVMHLANTDNVVTSKKMLCIVGIALLHITASSFDQFVINVIRGEGYAHQVVRDIGFMVPDLLQLVIPIWLFRKARSESYIARPFSRDKSLHKDIVTMLFFVFASFAICYILWKNIFYSFYNNNNPAISEDDDDDDDE